MFAQLGPASYRYFYDDAGQLIRVIDSFGNVVDYVYDEVGNIVEVRRGTRTAGQLAIDSFTPQRGGPGTQVVIAGDGFSGVAIQNQVRFNGTPASVAAATPFQITTVVPVGATTGPITVTVGGRTATTTASFQVTSPPTITSLSPNGGISGELMSVVVRGANLDGASFRFLPQTTPAPAEVLTVLGGSLQATLQVRVGPTAGDFVLVASSPAGESASAPSAANVFRVLDAHGESVALLSVLNTSQSTAPGTQTQASTALSALISVFNGNPLAPSASEIRTALSAVVSVLNSNATVRALEPPDFELVASLAAALDDASMGAAEPRRSTLLATSSRLRAFLSNPTDAQLAGDAADGLEQVARLLP